MDYLYAEPVKNEIYRYQIVSSDSYSYIISAFGREVVVEKRPLSDGSYLVPGIPPGVLWPEDEEWDERYQESLSMRVSQQSLKVFYIQTLKRGKKRSRVLVIGENGILYHILVPTVRAFYVGESFDVLRYELSVSNPQIMLELLDRVRKAGEENRDDVKAVS